MWVTRVAALCLGFVLLTAQQYNHPFVPRGGITLPEDMPEAELWVRCDTGVTISTGVSNWANQVSGGWPDLAQATGTDQPARLTSHFPSGLCGIQGDGTDDFLDMGSNQTLTGDWTWAIIVDDELTYEDTVTMGSSTSN
jgi:hypothetical protein